MIFIYVMRRANFHINMIIDCSEPWYSLIERKIKTVEGRKGTYKWTAIKIGDIVTFRDSDNHQRTFERKIIGINQYLGVDALEKYLKTETLKRTLPGIENLEDGKMIYLQWSTLVEIAQYGMLGLQLGDP